MAYAMVRTVRPKASATPSRPMPTWGKAAARTALPHPPSTSQAVPMNSAAALLVMVIGCLLSPCHFLPLPTSLPRTRAGGRTSCTCRAIPAAILPRAMIDPQFVPALGWIAPFAMMLLAIAALPLAAPKFWESNARKLGMSALLGLPVLVLYARSDPAALFHTGGDYLSFIILLGSLFVVSGGVLVTGDIEARPIVNTAFLAIGSVLASLIGTTGASVLLIRPLLSTNQERRHVVHTVVFFIFVVSNSGGCLTPLGDPPLFLGYLLGVPFTWTLRLLPHWLLVNGLLIAVYYFWDVRAHAREPVKALARDRAYIRPIQVSGKRNLALLLVVVAGVAGLHSPYREAVMLAVSAVSLAATPKAVREANRFTFHAIAEVAALFAGIFLTMLPALDILHARGASLGLTAPWHFFWATGFLSSFLDNAPTYLTFLAVAQSLGLPAQVVGVSHEVLAAISTGAVFMGANTYIGNGPNFMVRAIAEERGVRMPSFGGYMVYSGAVLIPCFVLVTFVFFR
ncbi:MAG: sodium:proton antiporter [Acidobacteria bacterium]|nr:MAG: sodium:proton antiporter [Acidobacteriota bacterium]